MSGTNHVWCRWVIATATVFAIGIGGPAPAATVQIVVLDGANEGFNDTTAVSPLPGNPGVTLGAQRLNAFQAAADAWGAILESNVTITVEAEMNPLTPCSATSGVIGSAGTNTVHRDFPNALEATTWYHASLANALAAADQSGFADIGATFNSDVDDNPGCLTGTTWWYGIGAPPAPSTIDFYTTVLHEIGHGIGVSTFVNTANGMLFMGFNDVYMNRLEDHSSGLVWSAMTDAQRMNSAIDTADLHWLGANVIAHQGVLSAGVASGHTRMYAPNPREPGSSVSHWDTALSPNELMEPSLTSDAADLLTSDLLRDIGWTTQTIFADGFESGNTNAWSSTVP